MDRNTDACKVLMVFIKIWPESINKAITTLQIQVEPSESYLYIFLIFSWGENLYNKFLLKITSKNNFLLHDYTMDPENITLKHLNGLKV